MTATNKRTEPADNAPRKRAAGEPHPWKRPLDLADDAICARTVRLAAIQLEEAGDELRRALDDAVGRDVLTDTEHLVMQMQLHRMDKACAWLHLGMAARTRERLDELRPLMVKLPRSVQLQLVERSRLSATPEK